MVQNMNFFTKIDIDSLLIYENNHNLQMYLDNCVDKIIDKQMIDYTDKNISDSDYYYYYYYYYCYYYLFLTFMF